MNLVELIDPMETVQKQMVDAAWHGLLSAPANTARDWMDQLCQREPALESYLFSADEHYSPSDERGIIFLAGFLIWRLLAGEKSKPLTDEALEKVQEQNVRHFYELDASSKHVFLEAARKLNAVSNQRPLIEFVLEILRHYFHDAPPAADANLRLALVHLKTVVDCLDHHQGA